MAAPTESPVCQDQRGFTLVELMVVLALMALAATAVVLTLRPGGGDARAEAAQFAARTASLRDRAVIEGRGFGAWVTASGYGFERRVDGAWQPLDDGRLSRRNWPTGTAVSLNGDSQGRVTFNRLGLPDRSVTVALTSGDSSAQVIIDASGDVRVK